MDSVSVYSPYENSKHVCCENQYVKNGEGVWHFDMFWLYAVIRHSWALIDSLRASIRSKRRYFEFAFFLSLSWFLFHYTAEKIDAASFNKSDSKHWNDESGNLLGKSCFKWMTKTQQEYLERTQYTFKCCKTHLLFWKVLLGVSFQSFAVLFTFFEKFKSIQWRFEDY